MRYKFTYNVNRWKAYYAGCLRIFNTNALWLLTRTRKSLLNFSLGVRLNEVPRVRTMCMCVCFKEIPNDYIIWNSSDIQKCHNSCTFYYFLCCFVHALFRGSSIRFSIISLMMAHNMALWTTRNDTMIPIVNMCGCVCVCVAENVFWIGYFDLIAWKIAYFPSNSCPPPLGNTETDRMRTENQPIDICSKSIYFFLYPNAYPDITWIHFCMANSWLLEC